MSFRFWRRIKIAPGVTLNLSKSGGSLSLGPRGAKFTVGPRGMRGTAGIPGTGLFYTKKLSSKKHRGKRQTPEAVPVPTVPLKDRLNLGFFKRLITPKADQAFVDGCREWVAGNEKTALEFLKDADHLADGAFLAGFLALKKSRFETAVRCFKRAVKKHNSLGKYFNKYEISATMYLPVTEEVTASVEPDLRGVLLGLVEAHQYLKQWREALECLKKLRSLEPEDVVIKLSLAELLITFKPDDPKTLKTIIQLAEKIQNESSVHATLMFYQARALVKLGLRHGALKVLTAALRRKKERPEDLLLALRYERAHLYGHLGKKRQARADFEKIFVDAPKYKDVAKILGI